MKPLSVALSSLLSALVVVLQQPDAAKGQQVAPRQLQATVTPTQSPHPEMVRCILLYCCLFEAHMNNMRKNT